MERLHELNKDLSNDAITCEESLRLCYDWLRQALGDEALSFSSQRYRRDHIQWMGEISWPSLLFHISSAHTKIRVFLPEILSSLILE
jgi:hypothetical protein